MTGLRGQPAHWTGRPAVRVTRRMVLLSCPAGHLLQAVAKADWAGSRAEAHATGYDWTCHGYINPRAKQEDRT